MDYRLLLSITIDNLNIVKYLHLAQVNIYNVEMINYHNFFLLFSVIIILIIIESCTCENFTMLRLSIVVVDNSRHIFPLRHLPIRCYLIVAIYQYNNNSGRRHTSTIFKFHLFSSLKLSQSIEFHPISMANFQRCLNKR